MCGIFAILNSKSENLQELRKKLVQCSDRIAHRGPDWSGQKIFHDQSGNIHGISHQRLQIIDPYGGEQPICDKQNNYILAVNGEIYNYREILASNPEYRKNLTTGSDCESIIPLWHHLQDPIKLNQTLAGVFSYVLWDSINQQFLISRDALGVNPLYLGLSESGELYISSEVKGFNGIDLEELLDFPPGSYAIYGKNGSLEIAEWYTPSWRQQHNLNIKWTEDKILSQVRGGLIKAVERRLMSDAPFGFLLSGGLDSSLVCSIANRLTGDSKINTYSIGLSGSPDLDAARKVSEYLGTKHHNFEFSVEQGISAIPKAIYHMETFDVTTIRAGTPMYLLSRKIKAMGTKMVLSGEGADEIFGGYLYFHQAPDAKEFRDETIEKVNLLYKYDCRRANKCTAAWGVEVRVPFLDRDYVDFVMSIPAELKMITEDHPMEKWLLRKAFEGYLPEELLWRRKEQFSDGVGYNWIDSLKEHAEIIVSDCEMKNAKVSFPNKTPKSKEAYFIRATFEEKFPNSLASRIVPWSSSIACSTERALKWREEWNDVDEPSGLAAFDFLKK